MKDTVKLRNLIRETLNEATPGSNWYDPPGPSRSERRDEHVEEISRDIEEQIRQKLIDFSKDLERNIWSKIKRSEGPGVAKDVKRRVERKLNNSAAELIRIMIETR